MQDSVEDVRTTGIANGKPGVLVIIFRQTGANIIATVDRVKALLPGLRESMPGAIDLSVMIDRSTTIRAAITDVEITLLIAIALVVLVVFFFLRNAWATAIPGVVVPLSLIGTFGIMYLLGYSIDNLSMMALTISTGFVVDDAIVVIENITRHLERGLRPFEAALRGAREVGFTVLSMSTSLVAVFIPILLMSTGGSTGSASAPSTPSSTRTTRASHGCSAIRASRCSSRRSRWRSTCICSRSCPRGSSRSRTTAG
ncbi:MAG: hypothetical protein AUH96_13765 [Nitrospirae bacterium 13_2_20CM_2_61_4]|nr:MAG: hypothetical protein AUH96_13765 [Nitrospirae bacterium 13_2_20CM_2_61_4]